MAKQSESDRDKLPASKFAEPDKRAYPIEDVPGAPRNAYPASSGTSPIGWASPDRDGQEAGFIAQVAKANLLRRAYLLAADPELCGAKAMMAQMTATKTALTNVAMKAPELESAWMSGSPPTS
ncbi:MAG: hypothetical protein ABI240_10330 [Sphingomonas sp.]